MNLFASCHKLALVHAQRPWLVGKQCLLNSTLHSSPTVCPYPQLDELRDHVGLLKKVCRQKALYCLKDVRIQASRGQS